MNRKKIISLFAAACVALQLQGCSSSQAPATQPPQSGTAVTPGQNQGPVDLTPELTINPSIVIGKTTMTDMIKKYGAPKMRSTKTEFKTDVEKQGFNGPSIEELRAPFKINPLTGEKSNDAYPMYFSTSEKPLLVSAPVFLTRGDIDEKAKNKTLTLEDIKKTYGTPTREAKNRLEYYDFERKIYLVIKKSSKGSISARVTKYDLLYGKNVEDMKAYEDLIKKTPLKDETTGSAAKE